jgi:hypothetical protein
MRLILALCAVFLLTVSADAASKSVTLYLDCARVENETVINKGCVEVLLPVAMKADSLRIKPLNGCTITHVEVIPAKRNRTQAREMAKLADRRDALEDRLKALDAREAIFKSAAKSQSGKAPRKSKTNTEPLTAVRQGTEFAIAQLENAYHARRITESELKSVNARLAELQKAGNGSLAKVCLAGKKGRVLITYLRDDLKWSPAYDFRLDKTGEVNIVMRAVFPDMGKEATVSVVSATLTEASGERAFPVLAENFPQVASFNFRVDQEKRSSTPLSRVFISFRNMSERKLPAGEASCFMNGEYLGKTAFNGSLPGEATEMTFGK